MAVDRPAGEPPTTLLRRDWMKLNRLIDHGEPAAGMCSLAWVIVTDAVDGG